MPQSETSHSHENSKKTMIYVMGLFSFSSFQKRAFLLWACNAITRRALRQGGV